MGLIFVPTPLGNLRDITLRALDVLRDCDVVVAEDTRTAMRLLNALDLPSKTVWSYREQNAAAATPAILERARNATVAVTTDAGMPAISDPGRQLVRDARHASIPVEVLPGPCAFVCAAVLSGFALEPLVFAGFVPRTQAKRERALQTALERPGATVWYESPNRILTTLADLEGIAPACDVFVGRELSKRYEQQVCGNPADVAAAIEVPPRGEFCIVVSGGTVERAEAGDVEAAIARAATETTSCADAARDLARRGFGDRNELYRKLVAKRRDRSGR